MVCRWLWITAFLLAVPGSIGAADPDPAAVDRVVEDALRAWDVPGAAVAVVRGDKVVVLKGYGRKFHDKPDPVTPDTVFPLASCTKAFTAAAVGALVDDGAMAWDDPVRKHLPGFKLSDPHADALVSVRDLLSHRTGVGSHDLLWFRAAWPLHETLKKVEKLPLAYPFRGGFEYSSILYAAAGRAAAHRAGVPWEQLVRDRITAPLGMTGVAFKSADIPPTANRAGGHRKSKAGAVEAMPEYVLTEPNPAGSMFATARDMTGWLAMQLGGGVANGRRVLSEKVLNETRTPQAIVRLEGQARAMNPDTVQLSYGLGWVVSDHRGKRVLTHGGVLDGFRSQMTVLPDDGLGIALFNNLHQTRMNQAITNTLIDLYCGLPPRDWNAFFLKLTRDEEAAKRAELDMREKARNPNTRTTCPAEGFVGAFENDVYGTARVSLDGSRLVLAWSSFRCPLDHFQGDVFRVADGFFEDRLVEFAVQPGGGATAVRFADVVFSRK